MEKVLLFNRASGTPPGAFLGSFSGEIEGQPYTLELTLDEHQTLAGTFTASGETLRVHAATLSNGGSLYGLLLEPTSAQTMAIFRASLSSDGLVLELDVPDPDERLDFSKAERVRLRRAAIQPDPNISSGGMP